MAKADKNELLYNVTLWNEGIQRLDGDVMADSDGTVQFRYRRRGSSAHEIRFIPKSSIVALGANSVLFRDRVPALRITKANVSTTKQSGNRRCGVGRDRDLQGHQGRRAGRRCEEVEQQEEEGEVTSRKRVASHMIGHEPAPVRGLSCIRRTEE